MQFIKLLTDTKTPFGNFYYGELRKVSDEIAGFLIGNGWAESADSPVAEESASEDIPAVTLEVDNANLGVNVEDINGG